MVSIIIKKQSNKFSCYGKEYIYAGINLPRLCIALNLH